MPESLHIETPSAPLALALIERLNGFHAEVVPCDDDRFQVRVDLEGRSGADRALLDSLDRVERWLESSDLDLAEVHLNGRSYRLERRDGKPTIQTHAEVNGLALSSDGGKTFDSMPIGIVGDSLRHTEEDEREDLPRFLGTYFDLVVLGKSAFIVYADNSSGRAHIMFVDATLP